MKKNAEVTGQIFMYIMAVVITAVLLIFGINAISGLKKSSEQAMDIKFENDIKSYFDLVNSASFGSERLQKFTINGQFKTICFVGKDVVKSAPSTSYTQIDEAIIAETADNLFMLSSISMRSIQVAPIYGSVSICQNITGNIQVRLKAKGDSVEVISVANS